MLSFVQVSWLIVVSEDFVPKVKVDYSYKQRSNYAMLLRDKSLVLRVSAFY